MNSKLFNLDTKDLAKGLAMAVISGVALPIAAMIQTPGFDIAMVNWGALGTLALNGAIVGFVSYLTKNLLSDEEGRVLGKIG